MHEADLSEMHEVFEAGIEVSLLAERTYASEVGMIYMCIHSKKPLENGLHNLCEILREWIFVALRKETWVINLQQQSILCSRLLSKSCTSPGIPC